MAYLREDHVVKVGEAARNPLLWSLPPDSRLTICPPRRRVAPSGCGDLPLPTAMRSWSRRWSSSVDAPTE